jgi:hypothetical protein
LDLITDLLGNPECGFCAGKLSRSISILQIIMIREIVSHDNSKYADNSVNEINTAINTINMKGNLAATEVIIGNARIINPKRTWK